MLKCNHYRQFVVLAFLTVLFSGYLCFTESSAGNAADMPSQGLVAIIKGRSGAPKQYIRVKIRGPEYKQLATDSNGVISTSLQPGDYIIQIRERGRLMEFRLKVNVNEVTRETFVLEW